MNNEQPQSQAITLNDSNQVSQVAYTYDQYGNITDKKEYDWGSGSAGSLLRENQTQYQYFTGSNNGVTLWILNRPSLLTVLNGSGTVYAVTHFSYDESPLTDDPGLPGHDSIFETGFTTRGNLTNPASCTNPPSCTTYINHGMTYGIAGNVVSSRDGNSNLTQFGYNDDGQNLYALPTSTTNALGQKTSARYDYGIGSPTDTYDLNGNHTHYTFGSTTGNLGLDRVVQVTYPNGGNAYASYPSAIAVVTQADLNTPGDMVSHAQNNLDGFGRTTSTMVFESGTQYTQTNTSYDALGRLATTTNPSRYSSNSGWDGNLKFVTTYAYDSLSRPTTVTTADGAIAQTSYAGNTTTIQDQAGHAKKYIYNGLQELAAVYEDPTHLNYATNYQYDPLGDLTLVSQGYCPSCEGRTFAYDAMGRLLSSTQPESGTITYGYDNAGNLTYRKDNRGIETSLCYDALNRAKQQTFSDGTPTKTYSYDGSGISNGIGQLTTASNANTTENYTSFDSLGHVKTSTQVTAGQTYGFAYVYNLREQLTSETYPSGRTLTTTYDAVNRASQLAGSLGGVQKNYVLQTNYAPQGAPSVYQYGNNLWRQNSYNSRLQVSQYVDMINNDPGSTL